jgi:LmbE family N-acetylglucosaminyl deacetylase
MKVEEALTRRPVMLVVAHPDDETLGAGGVLAQIEQPIIVHVTDGAPRNLSDARAAGYDLREEYARARRQELLNALELAGISPEQTRALNFADQEASLDMAYVALRVLALLREVHPQVVLTHSYEGGHPDHDATAFAVHAACILSPIPPALYEFTSYHAFVADGSGPLNAQGEAKIEIGRFLPGEDAGEVITLSAKARDLKCRMLECFASQARMLSQFPVDTERFRSAPVYDFSQPPHPGKLFYDYFPWGMTSERWLRLATQAARSLGISERL